VDQGSARGRDAALLDLVVRALAAMNAGADPRHQICADLGALLESDTSAYVTRGPGDALRVCSTGPHDPALVERAIRLLPADAHPFRFAQPHRDCVGVCLPLTVKRTRTTALVLSGGVDDTTLLEDVGRALREVDALLAGLPRIPQQRTPPPATLTPRETEVLGLLADGLMARTIAARLDLSPRTVHHHLGNIYEKLGVQDRLAAVLQARAAGLIPDHPVAEPMAGSR
jgi:DNA-binding CsgD family transcriptional regulator